jgi:hypothetical protein
MRVVAVAEHGNVDQVRRRWFLPDLGIDALQVDFLVKPLPNPIIAAVSNEMREAANVFEVPRFPTDCPRSPPCRRLASISSSIASRASWNVRLVCAPGFLNWFSALANNPANASQSLLSSLALASGPPGAKALNISVFPISFSG